MTSIACRLLPSTAISHIKTPALLHSPLFSVRTTPAMPATNTPASTSHTFRVWAPDAPSVTLVLGSKEDGKRYPMSKPNTDSPLGLGWWEVSVDGVGHGTDYGYLVEKNKYNVDAPLPDPRGAWLPTSVHGPSRVYDHSRFKWTDCTWRGVPLAG